jgi:lipid A disaccharide synthetase
MKKIVIIDGQGGKIGAQLIDAVRERCEDAEIVAVGTNSIATSAMLRNGPDAAATG